MGRPPCCDKSNVKRGLWTAEEDKKILAYVSTHGAGNWASVPKKAGLKRCGKSCRLRWTNYLRPDLKHDEFTPEEEQMIIAIHAEIGSRWSVIAGQLPGRTDNDVKNYWNTKLKKKLIELGIDPVTHKPISHVISSIHCLSGGCGSNTTSTTAAAAAAAGKDVSIARAHKQKDPGRVSCLSRELRNVMTASMLESPPDSSQPDAVAGMAGTSTPLQQAVGYDSKPSWQLLAQLRAVNKLVTDASRMTAKPPPPPSTPNRPPPWASSCSSFSLEADRAPGAAVPPHHFSWSDFIFHGGCPLPPMQSGPAQMAASTHGSEYTCSSKPATSEEVVVLLPAESTSLRENQLAVDDDAGGAALMPEETGMAAALSSYINATSEEYVAASAGSAPSASDIGSFVESLLNRDEEMTWEFPEFLDDPFTCP